ncbi:MAG: hypothetical protein ACE5FT_00635 [Candidatus Nanoarchaeia archaeon]
MTHSLLDVTYYSDKDRLADLARKEERLRTFFDSKYSLKLPKPQISFMSPWHIKYGSERIVSEGTEVRIHPYNDAEDGIRLADTLARAAIANHAPAYVREANLVREYWGELNLASNISHLPQDKADRWRKFVGSIRALFTYDAAQNFKWGPGHWQTEFEQYRDLIESFKGRNISVKDLLEDPSLLHIDADKLEGRLQG